MSPPAVCHPCHHQLHVTRVTSCMSVMSLPATCHLRHHQSHVTALSHLRYRPVSVLLQEVVLNAVHQAVKACHHGWLLHRELYRYHIATECLEVLRGGEGGEGGRRGDEGGRRGDEGGEGRVEGRGGKDEEGDIT